MFKCEKCDKEFESERKFSGHKGICGKTKECPVCKKQISMSSFSRHVRAHETDKSCPVCGKLIIEKRRKFCSQSCAAAYNNKGKVHNGKQAALCLNCGKRTRSSKSKYCSVQCQKDFEWREFKLNVKKCGRFPSVVGWNRIKRYIKEEQGEVCSICGRTEWEGKPIPLVLDHIDGNAENDSINNLRLVCGNCDMLLPTYKGKNRGNGRQWRKDRYQEGKSY